MPSNKKNIQKQKSFRDFFSNKKRKKLALSVIAVIALAGAYFLFFAEAAPNNCSPVEGGGICDVNQASSPDGADAVASTNDEVQVLSTQYGWTDWGVAFRAPNFPQNGAKPVHRFYRQNITAHYLVLEGSEDHARVSKDPDNQYEGVAFYAWPDGSQPGTVPIQRINRKPLYFLQMYVDNMNAVNSFVANPDGTWEDGGVNFWAYPAGYFPPQPAGTPTKDTDCANQNLKLGDQGACVQWHKGVLNGYSKYNNGTATLLDINNNTFDESTVNATKLFAMSLQSKGVKFTNFSGIVTKEIWDAFAAGYPAIPPTPTTPPKPPVVPTRPGPRPTPAPKPPTAPAPRDPGNTDPTPDPTSGSGGKSPAESCVARGGTYKGNTCKLPTGPASPNPVNGPKNTPPTPPRTTPPDTRAQYRCAYSWDQARTILSGYDRKSIIYTRTNERTTFVRAKELCEEKLKTWKLDNQYFYLYKGQNYQEYQTKDWQHKKVKNIRSAPILR